MSDAWTRTKRGAGLWLLHFALALFGAMPAAARYGTAIGGGVFVLLVALSVGLRLWDFAEQLEPTDGR